MHVQEAREEYRMLHTGNERKNSGRNPTYLNISRVRNDR